MYVGLSVRVCEISLYLSLLRLEQNIPGFRGHLYFQIFK